MSANPGVRFDRMRADTLLTLPDANTSVTDRARGEWVRSNALAAAREQARIEAAQRAADSELYREANRAQHVQASSAGPVLQIGGEVAPSSYALEMGLANAEPTPAGQLMGGAAVGIAKTLVGGLYHAALYVSDQIAVGADIVSGGALSRNIGSVAQAWSRNTDRGQAIVTAASHPIDTVTSIGQNLGERAAQAVIAYEQGSYWTAGELGGGLATDTAALLGGASALARGTSSLLGVGRQGVVADVVANNAPNIAYRAITPADAAALDQGLGLAAKAPNGTWTAAEHVANTGPGAGGAAANSPWISTSRSLDVAKAYDGGNGVIAIDLNRVGSLQVEVWKTAPRVNGVEGLPYHRSIWAQEVTIYQDIPAGAILGPVK